MARKNNQNTYPHAPPAPASIGDSQSSTTNPQISCSPGPLQPDPLISRFPLLFLSSVFYPNYPSRRDPAFSYAPRHSDRSSDIVGTKRRNLFQHPCSPPKPPIQASLPPSQGLYYAKQSQFSKPRNRRNLLHHTELQQYLAPPKCKKTNPNKPNLSRRNLWRSWIPPFTQYAAEAPPQGVPYVTCGAIRNTRYKPNLSRTGRHATYEIRHTKPNPTAA